MNSINELNRRTFLSVSGTAALAVCAGGLPIPEGRAAAPAGDRVAAVLKEIEARGERFLNIARKDAEFVNLFARAVRVKSVLEIGTAQGYGTLWLAAAAAENDGHVTTIEIVPERSAVAKANAAKAGLADRITFHQADAHELLPKLKKTFDFVLFNADKDGQVDYFNKLFPDQLASGAVLVAYRAISAREKMQEYLDLVAKHPAFVSTIATATTEEGLSISYRHRG